MGNKYQMEVQNFSDNLVTSQLIFNIFFTAQRECNFIYLLCLYLNWLNIFCKLRPAARLPVATREFTTSLKRCSTFGTRIEQGVTDSAIDEWRRRIRACVRLKGEHFEQKM